MLANPQTLLVLPLELDCRPAAVLFNFCAIVGLKKTLPAHIELIGKVANVHQALALEPIANVRIELLIDLPAIDDRRSPATLGRLDAIKPDQHGPAMHVRT